MRPTHFILTRPRGSRAEKRPVPFTVYATFGIFIGTMVAAQLIKRQPILPEILGRSK